jgi:tetratricopeptide (TPR) repeat protein
MTQGKNKIRSARFLGLALLATTGAFAQSQATQQQQQQPTQGQAPQQGQKPAQPQAAPLTLDSAPPPVSAEEDAAIKAFRDVPVSDLEKKEQAGEDFLKKYPKSRYNAEVYGWLVKGYLNSGQIDKMEAAGDKELALVPDDAQTLAILGSTLPRAMNANTPEPEKRLVKAEQYCQKALDLMPALVKPANVSDEDFQKAKNQAAALAYSGLGLVAFRRGKYSDAIPNFEQSVKLDPSPDPVNFYLLGISSQKTSHFDDAVTAFTKCAAIPGGLQTTCKGNIDEAKKLAATQLSAPK